MKSLLQPIFTLIMNLTDFNRLNRTARFVILFHLIFCIADGLSNIFISIYLWKIENNLFHVASFYFYQSLAFLVLIPMAGKRLKRQSPTMSIGIGSCCLALFYLSLLLLQTDTINYIPLLGLLQGGGYIFYWTSFHYLSILLTNTAERNLFNGYNEVSVSLASLVSPIIAGGLITLYADNIGYMMIFFISCLFFVITTFISAFTRVTPPATRPLNLRPILQTSIQPQNKWFWGMQTIFMQGLTDGLFLFLPSMIYFLFFQNEWSLGFITSILASLTLLSNFLVGRLLPDRKRHQAIGWGTFLHSLAVIIFFFYPSWITVLLFGLGIALAKPWYNIPIISTLYDFIHQQSAKKELLIEYLLARELSLGLGRICSFLLLMALIPQFTVAKDALTWLGLILAIGLPYIWLAVRRFNPNPK